MADVNLGTAEGKIVIDGSEAKKGAQQATDAVNSATKAQAAAADRLKTLGTNAAKTYGVAVVGGMALAVKAAMDFDQSLANVAAAGGKSAEGQMEKIRAKALQLGADTKFSATDAADAMEALIKAGLSVDDVLNGAADAAVNLAAAEGIDIPDAAEIAATAMTAFNLKASDMPKIADEISRAASATKMNVTDFAQAMNQAGAVSKLVGLNFDDMTLAITAMGKAGIVGSDAGTSLKTFLMNLQPQTKQQKKLFDELGITTDGMANKFYDANGKIRSMTDIAGVLNTALKGMTQQQKQAALETMFGSDAIRAAAIIADQGADGMKKLTAEMQGQLSVADKAAVKQNTLAGAVEKMKGSMETAAIKVGTALIPILRTLAGVVEKVADWFGNLSPGVQTAILWFGIGSTALLGFGFAAVKVVGVVKDINAVFGITKGISGFIDMMGVAKLRAGMFVGDSVTAISGMGTKIASGLSTARTAIGVWAIDAAQGASKAGTAIGNGAKAAATGGARFASALATGAAGMTKSSATMVASAASASAQYIASMASMVASTVAAGAKMIGQWIAMAAQAVVRAAIIATAWLAANPIVLIAAAIIAIVVLIIANWDKIVEFLTMIWNWIKDLAMTVWNAIKDFFVWLFNLLVEAVKLYFQIWITVITTVFNFIRDLAVTVWTAISDFFTMIFTAIRDFFVMVWNGIKDFLVGLWNGIKEVATTVWNAIGDFFTTVLNSIGNFFKNIWNGLVSFLSGIWDNIWGTIKRVWQTILDFFGGLGGKIMKAIGDFGSLLLEAGKNLLEGLWNGISNAAGWIWDKIKSLGTSIKDAFLGALGINSPSKMTMEIGAYVTQGLVVGMDNEMAALERQVAATANVMVGSGSPLGTSPTASAATTNNNYGASVNVIFNVYNPNPESASDTAARKMRTLSEMGAFG